MPSEAPRNPLFLHASQKEARPAGDPRRVTPRPPATAPPFFSPTFVVIKVAGSRPEKSDLTIGLFSGIMLLKAVNRTEEIEDKRGECVALSPRQQEWLQPVEAEVDAFLYGA